MDADANAARFMDARCTMTAEQLKNVKEKSAVEIKVTEAMPAITSLVETSAYILFGILCLIGVDFDAELDLDVDATSDEEESDAEPVFAAPERSLEDPVDGAGPLLLKGVVPDDDRLQRRHAQLVAQVTGRRAPPYGSSIPTAPRPPRASTT